MIKIPYNNDSFSLHLPWDSAEEPTIEPPKVYKVTITRRDTGAQLVSAEVARHATVLVTPAVSSGDLSLAFSSQLTPIIKGGMLRLASGADGPAEDAVLSHADGLTVHLDRRLTDSHAAGTFAHPMWATYDLDTSTVATWPLGLELTVRVDYYLGIVGTTVDSNFTPTEYSAKVVNFGLVPNDLKERFRAIYPAVFEQIETRYDAIEEEAVDRIAAFFRTKGRDVNLLVDSQMLRPSLIEQLYLLGAPRSDEWETERADAKATLDEQLVRLVDAPIWFDENQDDIQDSTEIGAQSWYPYNRGL